MKTKTKKTLKNTENLKKSENLKTETENTAIKIYSHKLRMIRIAYNIQFRPWSWHLQRTLINTLKAELEQVIFWASGNISWNDKFWNWIWTGKETELNWEWNWTGRYSLCIASSNWKAQPQHQLCRGGWDATPNHVSETRCLRKNSSSCQKLGPQSKRKGTAR